MVKLHSILFMLFAMGSLSLYHHKEILQNHAISNTAIQLSPNPNPEKEIQTINIGTQTWMKFNLNVSQFKNGDSIPQAKTREEWLNAGKNGTPAWCYYENNTANEMKYGKLYNWYAVNDSRGIAPKGWCVPSDSDWTVLTTFLGGQFVQVFNALRSDTGWYKNSDSANTSGFSALPSGYRSATAMFFGLTMNGRWWSKTEASQVHGYNRAWCRVFSCIPYYDEYRYNTLKSDGLSIRCIKISSTCK